MNDKVKVVQKLKVVLNEMSQQTDKAMHTILSKEKEIKEHCVNLRNKVDIESEILIEKIREWNEDMKNEINEYEKECLDKFNEDGFKKSACKLKALVDDVNDHQKNVDLEIERIKELINETSAKLTSLKRENMMVKRQKFGKRFLKLNHVKFDPSGIDSPSSLSADGLKHLTTIRDMSDIKEATIFINPFAYLDELIAIVQDKSDKLKFIKMDGDGHILKEKDTDLRFKVDSKIQTLEDSFIIQRQKNCQLMRFDYDFNVIKMSKKFDFSNMDGFTANQRFIISIHREQGKELLRFSNHDLSEVEHEFEINGIDMILATDKYLYVWYDNLVEIIDIECREGRSKPQFFDDEYSFICDFFDVKMLGDKYIATYSYDNSVLRLYTADGRLEFVKEERLDLIDVMGCRMSQDCSREFCFYNQITGDIYHNLFPDY